MITKEILKEKKLIFGMVHLKPLPGSPNYTYNNKEIIESALKDAEKLVKGIPKGMLSANP